MSSDQRFLQDNTSGDLQKDIQNKSPTVGELLKMLSGSSTISKQSPPPVPPKPKHGIEMSIDAAKRSLGLIPGFKKFNKSSIVEHGDVIPDLDIDKKTITISQDFNRSVNESVYPSRRSDECHDPSQSKKVISRVKMPTGGCVVYDSSAVQPVAHRTSEQDFSYSKRPNITMTSNDEFSYRSRPIVTESPDETNNNIIRPESTSTVEIHEMPHTFGRLSRDIHGNFGDDGHKTFSRLEQLARNAMLRPTMQYMNPTTIPSGTTDNDGGYDVAVDCITNEDLKLIDKESVEPAIDVRPPRTSTPTNTQYQIDNNSSSGASTATNNKSSQNTYLSHGTHESQSDNSENDTLNVSRETDELTNTSGHNQSGCELVGLNDSDSRDNSPKKANDICEQEVPTPYTVQIFNDTIMSSTSSPPNHDKTNTYIKPHDMSTHETEKNTLLKIVTDLQGEIFNLHSKVSRLTSKVDDLEKQLERHKKEPIFNKSTSSIFSPDDNQNIYSPTQTLHKSTYYRSVSPVNKMVPKVNRNSNSSGQSSLYSRNSLTSIHPTVSNSSSSQTYLKPKLATSNNPRRWQAQQHINSTACSVNGSMKRLNLNASTNSVYAESNKSGSASTSPTPLQPGNSLQVGSPSSYSSLSHKRDPTTYTSMLSLSSVGNSTLKKASVAGSTSNLSQLGMTTILSDWPSMSNFLQEAHQARDILYNDDEQIIRLNLYNNSIIMRVPSWIGSDYNLDRIVDAPEVKLKLDWVYGYRGRDCRTNIYYLPTGESIYFVASIVVLYNLQDKTQRHYLGHTDSVKCIAIHPNKLIVASGQSASASRRDKRPIVRVWNTVNLTTIRVIGFNEDFDRPICCLAFSKHDTGATLAVVDESSEHTITLLDWQRDKNWRLAEANSGHEPVLAIDFHPIDKYSLVAVGKSSVNFWDIRGMTLAKKAGLFDKYDRPKYVLCMTFNDLGETITGDSNGNIIIWPRGANKPRRIIRDVHPGGVFSVQAMKDGTYLTGGRNRIILEWDDGFTPTGRHAELPEHCGGVRFITCARGSQVIIGTLRNSILVGSLDTELEIIMQGHSEATTALAIHPNQTKYLTGGFDDQILLIDAHTHIIEWAKCMAMPITAASYSPQGQLLILGSTHGNWMALDASTQETLFTACDGIGTINCVKFSTDGEGFCMGSSDCHIYVYQTNELGNVFKRIGTCVGHSGPIKELDWSQDNNYFQSQSMNFELLFWQAQNCRPLEDDKIVHDLKWATHNCTIGFNVIGIWSDSIDSALINYCDKSNNDRLIAAVTDTGYLNMYSWPTYYNQCLSQKYYGNTDKFNFVKFLYDDSKLIAVGAKSCVTTEWSIEITEENLD